MLVDGKKISEDLIEKIKTVVSKSEKKLSLGILSVGDDPVSKKFIERKEKLAKEFGVEVLNKNLDKNIGTNECVKELLDLISQTNGVIVQLPLPEHIDKQKVFENIPASHDVDCLGIEARDSFERGDTPLLPPVVSAIKEILERYSVDVSEKSVVVVGKGILVGDPVAKWFSQWGAHVANIDEMDEVALYTKKADIVVLGAGDPHFLKKEMIKEGSIVLDAGTSESAGKIAGDADPNVEEKALLLSPVPGGIGPIVVAKIFENLLVCNSIST